MPSKNFSGALSRQRVGKPGGTSGVVGDIPGPLREEIEAAAEHLVVQLIDIDRLHDNPFQNLARPVIDEEALEDLAASIRQNGFYGALVARPRRNATGQYEIAYGHRRREASRKAGLKNLPVKVMDLTDLEMAQLMASENFSREDLTPLGEANIIGHLYTDQNMSVEQIAAAIGKKRGWIQPRLVLFQSPLDVKQLVEKKPEALSHARLLQQVKDPDQRASLIDQIVQHNLTFEQLNSFIANNKASKAGPKGAKIDTEITNYITDASGEKGNNQQDGKQSTRQSVKKITNYITDANSERSNNVSQETITGPVADPVLSPERLQRADLLRRIDKAAQKFDNLARQQNYKLAQDERSYLSDLVERLKSILER